MNVSRGGGFDSAMIAWLLTASAVYACFWWYILESAGGEVYGFETSFTQTLGLLGLNQAVPFVVAVIGLLIIGTVDRAITDQWLGRTQVSPILLLVLIVAYAALLSLWFAGISVAIFWLVSFVKGWSGAPPNMGSIAFGLSYDLILIFVFLQFVWALTRKWYWSILLFLSYAVAVVLFANNIGYTEFIGFGTTERVSPTVYQPSPFGTELSWKMRMYWTLIAAALVLILVGFDPRDRPLLSLPSIKARVREGWIPIAFSSAALIAAFGWGAQLAGEKNSDAMVYDDAEAFQLLSQHVSKHRPTLRYAAVDLTFQEDSRSVKIEGMLELRNESGVPLTEIVLSRSPVLDLGELSVIGQNSSDYDAVGSVILVDLAEPLLDGDTLRLTYFASVVASAFNQRSQAHVQETGFFLDTASVLPTPQRTACFGESPSALPECTMFENYQASDEAPVRVRVDVPNSLAVANAELSTQGRDRSIWVQDYPDEALQNIFVAAGEFKIAQVKDDQSGTDVTVYLAMDSALSAEMIANYVAQEIGDYSSDWGRMRSDSFWIIETPAELDPAVAYFGGATISERYLEGSIPSNESPSLSARLVLSHEIAHQWLGYAIVPLNKPGWPVVIESLTQFAALNRIEAQGIFTKSQISEQIAKQLDRSGSDAQTSGPLELLTDSDWRAYYEGPAKLLAIDKDGELMGSIGSVIKKAPLDEPWEVDPGVFLQELTRELPEESAKELEATLKS